MQYFKFFYLNFIFFLSHKKVKSALKSIITTKTKYIFVRESFLGERICQINFNCSMSNENDEYFISFFFSSTIEIILGSTATDLKYL